MVVDTSENLLIERIKQNTNTIISEVMNSLFKESAPISGIACMQALYTFLAVKGNSDILLSFAEDLKLLSNDIELLSRVYAFVENESPDFGKVKTLEAFNYFLASKAEQDKILYVENVDGEIRFTGLASLPSESQQKYPYGYFAL